MSQPTQTCDLCGQSVTVTPYGRGFPPDVAKRKLKKLCAAIGCKSKPSYLAGVTLGGPIVGQTAGALIAQVSSESGTDVDLVVKAMWDLVEAGEIDYGTDAVVRRSDA